MQRIGLKSFLGASLCCAVLVTGCGQPVSVVSPATDLQSRDPQQSGATQHPGPTPGSACEGSPLGCSKFTSVRGRDASGDIAWLGTDPLKVSSGHTNGAWTLLIHTPCNHLEVAVSVQADMLRQLWRTVTDRGCIGATASYQAWTEELFEQPVRWALDGDTLTLANSHATIELKEN